LHDESLLAGPESTRELIEVQIYTYVLHRVNVLNYQ